MYKAKISFSGQVSMRKGEVRDISDLAVAKDLLRAGYIEELEPEKKLVKTAKPRTKK